jgi:hypothetical protein
MNFVIKPRIFHSSIIKIPPRTGRARLSMIPSLCLYLLNTLRKELSRVVTHGFGGNRGKILPIIISASPLPAFVRRFAS